MGQANASVPPDAQLHSPGSGGAAAAAGSGAAAPLHGDNGAAADEEASATPQTYWHLPHVKQNLVAYVQHISAAFAPSWLPKEAAGQALSRKRQVVLAIG